MRRTLAALCAAALLLAASPATSAGAPSASTSPSATSPPLPHGPDVVTASIGARPAQTMAGFGVSDDRWAPDLYRFPAAVRTRVANLLFTPAGLDLSAYRYTIGAGSGTPGPRGFLVRPGRYDWSANPGADYFLRAAGRDGVTNITGFSNSAPGVFTTDGRNCGGWLRPGDVGAYASYLTDVVTHIHDAAGVTLTAVSPMNEPDWSFPRCFQEGMHVRISARAALIEALGRDLAARAPYAGVVADESSHLVTQLLPELPGWLGTAGATQRLQAITYHDYGPGPPDPGALQRLAGIERRFRRPAWMTEICCENGHTFGPGYDPAIRGALWMADRMWMDLTLGNVSLFDWWRALSPSIGCDVSAHPACASRPNPDGWDDGLLYYDPSFARDGDHRIFTTKRYFVFGNVSRYVRPGAVRWPIDGSTWPLRLLAFRSNGAWSVVVVDDGTQGRTLELSFPHVPGERLVPTGAVRTSPTQDLASVADPTVEPSTGTLVASIPPQSVTTFVLSVRPDAESVPASGHHKTAAPAIVVALVAALGVLGIAARPRRRRVRAR